MDCLEYDAPWGRMRIGVARRFASRLRGLLGRRHLQLDQGLLILPCRSIHTFGMQFSIDVLALDGSGRVVAHIPAVPPGRIVAPGRGVRMILEMAAGAAGDQSLVGYDFSGLVVRLEGMNG